jgi:nitrate/nitrite transporter NarK
MTEKGKRAGIGVGIFGGAGLIGVMALGTLSACFVAALAEAMDVWLAALIVTVVYAAVGGVLALRGRDRIRQATPPAPEQTADSGKEDVQWAKTQVPSGRR